MNTAQVLVELLKEYRVEHIFGVPGDTTMPLYDALYDARSEIRHIMARDERSAAFMADERTDLRCPCWYSLPTYRLLMKARERSLPSTSSASCRLLRSGALW